MHMQCTESHGFQACLLVPTHAETPPLFLGMHNFERLTKSTRVDFDKRGNAHSDYSKCLLCRRCPRSRFFLASFSSPSSEWVAGVKIGGSCGDERNCPPPYLTMPSLRMGTL